MSAVEWFAPGVAVAFLVAYVAGGPMARWLGTGWFAAAMLVAAAGIILAATLTPIRDPLNLAPSRTCDFSRIGLIPWKDLASINDSSLNILLFVPLGFLVGLLPTSRRKWFVLAAAALLPVGIEAIQRLVPMLSRSCQSADVTDNMTGLAVGLAAGLLVGGVAARLHEVRRGEGPPGP